MPGQEVTQLVYEFIGETDQLNKAAVQVQETIQKNVEQPMAKMNEAGLLSGKKLRMAFFGVGEAISVVAGPQIGNLVFRLTAIMPIIESVGGSFGKMLAPIVNFMSGQWGVVLLGIGAVIAAVMSFGKQSEAAAKKVQSLADAQTELNTAMLSFEAAQKRLELIRVFFPEQTEEALKQNLQAAQKGFEALVNTIAEKMGVSAAEVKLQLEKAAADLRAYQESISRGVFPAPELPNVFSDSLKETSDKALDLQDKINSLKWSIADLEAEKVKFSKVDWQGPVETPEMRKAYFEEGRPAEAFDALNQSADEYWERLQKVTDAQDNMVMSMYTVGIRAKEIFSSIGSAAAGAFTQALLTARTFGSAMTGIMTAVSSAFIGCVMKMFFEWISAKLTEMITGSVAAYSGIPFVGLALGLAAAVAMIAASRSLAAKEGGKSFAAGGLIMSPMLAMVGDAAGGEVVAPRSKFDELFDRHGSGDIYLYNMLDSRVLTEAVVKNAPGIVRVRGGVRGS